MIVSESEGGVRPNHGLAAALKRDFKRV